MAGRRCADWRFPTEKQAKAEETARRMQSAPLRTPRIDDPPPDSALPAEYWDAVLQDPRAAGRPWLPIQQRRLSEIPRDLLRIECLKCFRVVEIQRLDAVKLYGPHAVWKDIGDHLLAEGCQHRTGNRDSDGCWPDFS